MHIETREELERIVQRFFSRCEGFRDTTRKRFRTEYKVSEEVLEQAVPTGKWAALREEWARAEIDRMLEEMSQSAVVRGDFTRGKILLRLKKIGIGFDIFDRLARQEWRRRKAQFPTSTKKKILTTIRQLVASGIPVRELTQTRVIREAGMWQLGGKWFRDAMSEARVELLRREGSGETMRAPSGERALVSPHESIDLDADVWDLRSEGGQCLKRNLLRKDLADIAWALMHEDLLDRKLSCTTVSLHYNGYRCAGNLLGDDVPDVCGATLESVQRAWLKYDVNPARVLRVREALRKIFYRLCDGQKKTSGTINRETLLIACWLSTSAKVRRANAGHDFLSDSEMNATIIACLLDIKAGMDFIESNSNILNLVPHYGAEGGAEPLIRWAIALMLLLMLFTGLRPQSLVSLKVGDWSEIRPGLYALIWSHGKKREEKVAVLTPSIASMLDFYVRRTMSLRGAVGTDQVFLVRNVGGWWVPLYSKYYLLSNLKRFAERHRLTRAGERLNLTSQIIRRTYVTRELYDGRSIRALSLQLGHESIRTTRRYGMFDQFEHPAEVGPALDAFAQQTLTLWHQPLPLADLNLAERELLLGLQREHHQDLCLCRSNHCLKSMSGSPPPCSLCNHLATGPEFVPVWEEEQGEREDEIGRLLSSPDTGHLAARKKAELEMFNTNFAFVKGRSVRERVREDRLGRRVSIELLPD
jgi:integrase